MVNLPITGVNKVFGTTISNFGYASGALNQALTEGAGFPTERTDAERLGGAVIGRAE